MNLGPNRLLFNNDLIKDLIFNTELSDKVKLNEIINLLFEGKPHSASREEILQMVPEFVKNNFRRIVLFSYRNDSIHTLNGKEVVISLPNTNSHNVLMLNALKTHIEKRLTAFVFTPSLFYGYSDIMGHLRDSKNNIFNFYTQGLSRDADLLKVGLSKFDFTGEATCFAIFGNGEKEVMNKYEGALFTDSSRFYNFFDFEDASRNFFKGGTLLKYRSFARSYALGIGRRSTRVIVKRMIRGSFTGPEVAIDKKTKKLRKKAFNFGESTYIGPKVTYFATGKVRKEEWYLGGAMAGGALEYKECIANTQMQDFFNIVEKQQEDLYDEYKTKI